MNAAAPKDMRDYMANLPSIADSEAQMKADAKTVRHRSSTARAARVARAEADRIEGLRQAAKQKREK